MEYLLLIFEFTVVKGKKFLFFNVLLPIMLGFLIFYCSDFNNYKDNASTFNTNVITLLGIFIGFSISTLTLLLSINNVAIEESKKKSCQPRIEVFNKEIFLFDSVVISLAYLVVIQSILLMANFIYPIFVDAKSCKGKLLFSINIPFVIHVIITLMRSVLDFYFILTKKAEPNE